MLGNRGYRIYPVRGEYCELVRAKSYLVNNLVYPLPHTDGLSLGLHLTRTLWGTVLVGPTADYISGKNDYERNRLPVEEFVRRAKPMLPEIEAADLQLAYSGIRAKLVPPGHGGVADFVMMRDDLKGSTRKAPVPLAANLHVKELICRPAPRDPHIKIVAGNRASPRSGEILAIAMERQHPQDRARLRGAERRFLFFTQRAKFSSSPCDHRVRDVILHFRRRRSRTRRK